MSLAQEAGLRERMLPGPVAIFCCFALSILAAVGAWGTGWSLPVKIGLAVVIAAAELMKLDLPRLLSGRRFGADTSLLIFLISLASVVGSVLFVASAAPPKRGSYWEVQQFVSRDVWERTGGCSRMSASDKKANDQCADVPDWLLSRVATEQSIPFIILGIALIQILSYAPPLMAARPLSPPQDTGGEGPSPAQPEEPVFYAPLPSPPIRHPLPPRQAIIKEIESKKPETNISRIVEDAVIIEETGDLSMRDFNTSQDVEEHFTHGMTRVNPNEINKYLWPSVIPRGALTLLSGQPKVGKSQIAICAAAIVSKGGFWPTGERAPKGGVIIIELEDTFADTKLRLQAAGADLRHILIRDSKKGPLDLSTEEGIAVVKQAAANLGDTAMLIVSPGLACFGPSGATDDATVRRRLAPLLQWAAEANVAVVMITHPPKAARNTPEAQFSGADAYRRAARSAYYAAVDPTDPNPVWKKKRRGLYCAGVNGGNDETQLFYKIEGVEIGGFSSSRVRWLDPEEETETPVFDKGWATSPESDKDGSFPVDRAVFRRQSTTPEKDKAKKWLEAALADGPWDGNELKAAAKEAGVSQSSLEGAAKELGVQRIKTGKKGGIKAWALPSDGDDDGDDGSEGDG